MKRAFTQRCPCRSARHKNSPRRCNICNFMSNKKGQHFATAGKVLFCGQMQICYAHNFFEPFQGQTHCRKQCLWLSIATNACWWQRPQSPLIAQKLCGCASCGRFQSMGSSSLPMLLFVWFTALPGAKQTINISLDHKQFFHLISGFPILSVCGFFLRQ